MLTLYREVIALRASCPELGDGPMQWVEAGEGLLAFQRGSGFLFVLNCGGVPARLPAHDRVLLASGDLVDGVLPVDCAVWLSTTSGRG